MDYSILFMGIAWYSVIAVFLVLAFMVLVTQLKKNRLEIQELLYRQSQRDRSSLQGGGTPAPMDKDFSQ